MYRMRRRRLPAFAVPRALAVAGGEQRMVVENGEPQVATVMTVSLSSDHRVIDGAVAAQFLQVVMRFMETPSLMLA